MLCFISGTIPLEMSRSYFFTESTGQNDEDYHIENNEEYRVGRNDWYLQNKQYGMKGMTVQEGLL